MHQALRIPAFGAAALVGLASLAAAQDSAFMDEVAEAVVRYAGPQSDWRGPTTSPPLAEGKHIAYVSSNQQNDASREWGTHIEEIGGKIGWDVTVIDGQGRRMAWVPSSRCLAAIITSSSPNQSAVS